MQAEVNYVVVSPYGTKYRCGIVSYTHNLYAELLKIPNVKPILLENTKNLGVKAFEKFVLKYIQKNFKPENTIVECPEVHSICKNLPQGYFLHVRLHCSSVITAALNKQHFNEEQVQGEISVIKRANIVSSPSRYLLLEMQKYFNISKEDLDKVLIYPNPLDLDIKIPIPHHKARKFDLCFIANFSPAKGIEYLNAILEELPKHYNICICGAGAKLFKFSKNIKCKIEIYSHIVDKQKIYKIMANSRFFLNLSKFESFGIGAFEALSLKTVTVGFHAPAVQEYVKINGLSSHVQEITNKFKNIIDDTFEVPSVEFVQEKFISGFVNLLHNRNYYGIMHFKITLHHSVKNLCSEDSKGLFKLGYMQIRKVKKLLRHPHLFFYDMLKNMQKRRIKVVEDVQKTNINDNITKKHAEVVKTALEPREFARIGYNRGVSIEIPGRAINNTRYSSIIFLEDNNKSLVHNKLASVLLAGKEQMSLREKTLFFVKYAKVLENYDFFANYNNILDFRANLLKSEFKQIKTFFFVNPCGNMPFFFRSLFVNSRIVLFVNDEKSLEYILQFKSQIDVLVVDKSLITTNDISAIRRVITIEENFLNQACYLMQKIIIENAKRETEVFLPVLGECGYTTKIQEYNKLLQSGLLDGVFIVKNLTPKAKNSYHFNTKGNQKCHQVSEFIQTNKIQTFAEVAQNVSKGIIGVLFSENAMFRYRTLIAQGNLQVLFQFTLEDNLRIKIVNKNDL
jgi:glycosyltransferase involved in cell wall biosynthesis